MLAHVVDQIFDCSNPGEIAKTTFAAGGGAAIGGTGLLALAFAIFVTMVLRSQIFWEMSAFKGAFSAMFAVGLGILYCLVLVPKLDVFDLFHGLVD